MFTARFLCFRRFPAAPLHLGTLVRTRNHFPGLYCRNTHSLRPSKTTFPHKCWPERHLGWEEQWHGVCKSRAGHGNTIKNVSKTKGKRKASFASYCLKKVDNKRRRAIRQRNVSGKMKRNGARDEGKQKEIYLGKQWNVNVNTMAIGALNEREAVGEGLELLREAKESPSEDRENRGAKQNKDAGEGLELTCGRKGVKRKTKDTARNTKESSSRRTGTSDCRPNAKNESAIKKDSATKNKPDRKQKELLQEGKDNQHRNILHRKEAFQNAVLRSEEKTSFRRKLKRIQ